MLINTEKVTSLKTNGLSIKKLTSPFTTDNSLSQTIKWLETIKSTTYNPPDKISFLTDYKLDIWS